MQHACLLRLRPLALMTSILHVPQNAMKLTAADSDVQQECDMAGTGDVPSLPACMFKFRSIFDPDSCRITVLHLVRCEFCCTNW